jgi:phage tail-like protein
MSNHSSKLPGTFTIYPKGPKPKSTAPHGQHAIATVSAHFSVSSPKGTSLAKAKKEPAKAKQPKEIAKAKDIHHLEDWDPYGSYYFALEINGYEVGHFQECSGLKNACAVFEIEEGGLNGKVHKRPGQSKWENIILKCATSASQFLVSWRDLYLQDLYAKPSMGSGSPGETDGKRDWWGSTRGSISLKDNSGKVIRKYSFVEAWPVSWEGPSLNATASGLAIETLEIAHGGLTVETVA